MKTAKDLYDLTMSQAPELVAEILSGVREHIITSCERDARKGATYYTIYLRQGHYFIQELLLEECMKMSKEFENNGYKVSIEYSGNGYYINFIITVSWNGQVQNCVGRKLGGYKELYTTDKGIVALNKEGDD